MSSRANHQSIGPATVTRWLVAVACLLCSGFIWITRGETLLAGHPGYPVFVTVLAGLGVLAVVRIVRVRHGNPGVGRGAWWKTALRLLGALLVLLACGIAVWLRPFPASGAALSQAHEAAGVQITDQTTSITITPDEPTTSGLVFQPGARVDPRAYLRLLSQVAADGHLVVIVKQPLDIGLLATAAPEQSMTQHPQVTSWFVGGHSLGGVAAASFAQQHPEDVDGLLLWASYPLDSMRQTQLAVTSISGSRDGFTTPADIEKSRGELPPDTTFVTVDGAVHSYFGDYGDQPGDGVPTVSRESAQRTIVATSVDLLSSGR